MAKPTAFAKPWPRGPVVTSMPAVTSRWEMRDKRTARERTIGMPGFGVTRRLGVYLTKSFEIVHGELVAQEMQEDILEGTSGMIDC